MWTIIPISQPFVDNKTRNIPGSTDSTVLYVITVQWMFNIAVLKKIRDMKFSILQLSFCSLVFININDNPFYLNFLHNIICGHLLHGIIYSLVVWWSFDVSIWMHLFRFIKWVLYNEISRLRLLWIDNIIIYTNFSVTIAYFLWKTVEHLQYFHKPSWWDDFKEHSYSRQENILTSKSWCYCPPNARGYTPKVFAFKNPYLLNPKKSDLFYFLLIRMKRPKSPKWQRAVSSSSALHAIKRIPRDTTTLAFLLILLKNADSRGMRKSLLKVPIVVDFALPI